MIVSLLPLILKEGWSYWKRKKQAEQEQEILEIKAGFRDPDKWLRRTLFVIIYLPFMWAIVDPEAVRAGFSVIREVIPPEWWQMAIIIAMAVWGISAGKKPVLQILDSVRKWKRPAAEKKRDRKRTQPADDFRDEWDDED